jgi:hypothetical protein
MYGRRNDYLKRRMERQDYRRGGGRDYRRGGRDMRDYREDYMYEDYGTRGNKFYYEDRNYPYPDYGMGNAEKEYEKDLKEWAYKLAPKDRFKIPEHQIIQQAKNMGVKFEEYSEEEFYAIYLAMVTDYRTVSNDYNTYIKMAKDFLEDDDMAVSPSEKVCIYLYEIVLGGK